MIGPVAARCSLAVWCALVQEQQPTEPRTDADRRILAEADAIEQEVARLRGKPFQRPVAKQVYSREQLAGFLEKNLSDPEARDELGRDQTFLTAIGFLPPDTSLATLYHDMLLSQVAGFYDPKDRTLRCISTDVAVVQRLTLVHEIYHSLQDQYFPLEPYMEGPKAEEPEEGAPSPSDDARARQAVVEGDAQFFTTAIYAPEHRDSVRDDLKGQDPRELLGFGLQQALAQTAIPPYFVDQLTWSYLAGAQFIQTLYESGGWPAVDQAFVRPPRSSEEILHPRKYLDGGDDPRVVAAPVPAFAHGRDELTRDTVGEATIAALLRHLGHDPVHAMRGSEGWGGDQVVVLRGPVDGAMSATLLVWKLEWDSARDGEQFFAAWRRVLLKQYTRGEGGSSLVLDGSASGFAGAGREPLASPSRWSGCKLPDDVSACVAESGDAGASWLLRRGEVTLLLRGSELATRRPGDLVALIDQLVPSAPAATPAAATPSSHKESDR